MSVVMPKKDGIGSSGTQEAFLPLVVTLDRSNQGIAGLSTNLYSALHMKRLHVQIPQIGRNASKGLGRAPIGNCHEWGPFGGDRLRRTKRPYE